MKRLKRVVRDPASTMPKLIANFIMVALPVRPVQIIDSDLWEFVD